MKKWLSVFTFVLLIIVIMPSTGCTSRIIATEVADSLIKINEAGLADIDAEITSIDRKLHDTQVDLLKLEQLLNAASKWIDYQKEISRPGKWAINVTPDGLSQFQNDRYALTSLEVIITRDSLQVTESSYNITVRDSLTMQTDNATTLYDSLVTSQNSLQQNRQAMADARSLSIATMNNLLKYVNDWKIKKVSGTTYSISGPGLGWSQQLTSGTWKYDREKGTLVPDDKQADCLNTIILGEAAYP